MNSNADQLARYIKEKKIGKGTYGTVWKAQDTKTNQDVAWKKMIIHNENEGIPSIALREISLVKAFNHPNIIRLQDIIIAESKLNLIFEYHDQDLTLFLKSLPKDKFLDPKIVKMLMYQILSGVAHCHAKRVIHRDQKPQNILIDRKSGKIKIADFGLARAFSIPNRPYTEEVATLWYRAPEILLGSIEYSTPIDIWSIGVIFVEMVTKMPLFMGDSPIDQLYRIFRILGTPNEEVWQGVTKLKKYKNSFPNWIPGPLKSVIPNLDLDVSGLDLLNRMLKYDPCERISAKSALSHPYFKDVKRDIKEQFGI